MAAYRRTRQGCARCPRGCRRLAPRGDDCPGAGLLRGRQHWTGHCRCSGQARPLPRHGSSPRVSRPRGGPCRGTCPHPGRPATPGSGRLRQPVAQLVHRRACLRLRVLPAGRPPRRRRPAGRPEDDVDAARCVCGGESAAARGPCALHRGHRLVLLDGDPLELEWLAAIWPGYQPPDRSGLDGRGGPRGPGLPPVTQPATTEPTSPCQISARPE